MPAIDGQTLVLSRFGPEYVAGAPAVHDDLDLVVRFQRCLQAQHELAALQRIARHDAEASARGIHVATAREESRHVCRP